MSHHYHEIDRDTCQDRVKEESSANSRPWVDEKRGLLLSITALNSRHTSGEWEGFQLHLRPTVIQGNRTGKYWQMWRLRPSLGIKGYKQLLISTIEIWRKEKLSSAPRFQGNQETRAVSEVELSQLGKYQADVAPLWTIVSCTCLDPLQLPLLKSQQMSPLKLLR